ncbi:hypothetical protein [Halalkalicoccus sp. NIPERK01]|uniref:DUF7577 domain-containing protein n=1 Tax=Halalkalicoccus sp. NIPERK01 TaxID=3053469 RepID=UPI00256EEA4F|nr:hypothetical protein [Halalkalicoccus sp. NIPERK01]MDL5360592.1 hypothetical protein [Halalkalicoccus sp. NIPERK01]
MASIGQLLGILLVCTLFYVVGSYCLGQFRRGADDESGTPPAPLARSRNPLPDVDRADPSPSSVTCRTCQTENDPAYTYCKHCISELHAHRDQPHRHREP